MRVNVHWLSAGVLLAAGALLVPLLPAGAVQSAQTGIVSAVPSTTTPDIANGRVEEITQVGTKVIVGGTFTSAGNHGSTTTVTRNRILAFDASSGTIDPRFAPSFNNVVQALLPGPSANTVYVGGRFSTLNGVGVNKILLLDTNTGAVVTSFKAPAFNAYVADIKRFGSRLYVGGAFTKVGGFTHAGFVTLDANSGALDSFMNLQIAGHHNWTSTCGNCSQGAVSVNKIDINPAGTRLAAIGNFKTVNGGDYDQAVLVDISGTSARIASWQTNLFDARCFAGAYDSWIRDVDFSPDGTYFVIVATGGPDGTNSLCDSASRWETTRTGSNLAPTWTDWTGGDTLLSVAVTGSAVYVGGHQRWLNNAFGWDKPGRGAVARPGLAALDPASGVPLSWNPGRNPRGAGAYALFASPTGLYVGSDTDYIGNYLYLRKKIAYFPLSGGTALPSGNTGSLPANVYLAGPFGGLPSPDAVVIRYFDGANASSTSATSAITWQYTRGAFMVGGTLFYGWADGTFHRRTFDGSTFGPDAVIDPYHDPNWDNVQTGSGQTYAGNPADFYDEITGLTGMFYSGGRLYYTKAGSSYLFVRYFSPQSGIVGAQRFQVQTPVSFADAAGLFLDAAHGWLYKASTADGSLQRVAWSASLGAPSGAWTVANAQYDWRAHGLFNYAG